MFYICNGMNENNEKITEIYIYNPSNMPKEGWIHSCFSCREFTARTILFKTKIKDGITYKFYFHRCPRCKNSHKDHEKYNEFSEKCEKYIYKKYFSITC